MTIPRIDHNWLSSAKLSPENLHTNNTIWDQQIIFWNMYVYTNAHIHAITIDLKRGHKFEGVQEGHMGMLGGKKWEGEMELK